MSVEIISLFKNPISKTVTFIFLESILSYIIIINLMGDLVQWSPEIIKIVRYMIHEDQYFFLRKQDQSGHDNPFESSPSLNFGLTRHLARVNSLNSD